MQGVGFTLWGILPDCAVPKERTKAGHTRAVTDSRIRRPSDAETSLRWNLQGNRWLRPALLSPSATMHWKEI